MDAAGAQGDALVIGLSMEGQLRVVAGLALFVLGCVAPWVAGTLPAWSTPWLPVTGAAWFGGMGVFGTVTAVRSRRWGWVLRLDAQGVTARGQDTVAWSSVAEIVVSGMRPELLFRCGRPRFPVVSFIPRPGHQLPAPRLPGRPGHRDRLGGARERLYGSRLVLMPHAMTASVEQITAAAARWGQVPARDTRAARRA